MKPISSPQPSESYFAQGGDLLDQRAINKTKQNKKAREIFEDFFPEWCWESKVSELRREAVLSRLKVLCGEAGKEKL